MKQTPNDMLLHARELRREAEYYETYQPEDWRRSAIDLYAAADKLEAEAKKLEGSDEVCA